MYGLTIQENVISIFVYGSIIKNFTYTNIYLCMVSYTEFITTYTNVNVCEWGDYIALLSYIHKCKYLCMGLIYIIVIIYRNTNICIWVDYINYVPHAQILIFVYGLIILINYLFTNMSIFVWIDYIFYL